MEGGRQECVWAPDLVEGYRLGIIEDVGADTLTVRLLDQPGKVMELHACMHAATCREVACYVQLVSLFFRLSWRRTMKFIPQWTRLALA